MGEQHATSYQVREELTSLIERDLLGPWDGLEEELPYKSSGPRDRYLVGMLGPAEGSAEQPGDTDLGDDADASDPELREVFPAQAGRLWASTMGLSFAVPADIEALVVTAEWGDYRKMQSEAQLREDGSGRRVWHRFPVATSSEIILDRRDTDTPAHEDYDRVRLRVRVRPRGGQRIVEVILVNDQTEPASNKDEAWLFQPRLQVTALDGNAAIFCPLSDPLADLSADLPADHEERHLAILYRDELEFASGRNVAVDAEVQPGERSAWRLTTTWLPTFDLPQTVPPDLAETPELTGLELRMNTLADLPREELATRLAPLAGGYAAWLDRQRDRVAEFPAHLRETAAEAIRRADQIAVRIRAGIEILADDDSLEAFRFANRAMALQRSQTDIVRQRVTSPELSYAEAKAQAAGTEPAWRPFQLAFILLNLPALTDTAHPDRAAGHESVVDLLFFPTGGGKTEAYLGLTAYTLAIRRLQGVSGEGEQARDGSDGTSVLMRYTLRLLTAQQFQRAAALICACEMLRQPGGSLAASGEPPSRLGDKPFRVGLWVGSKVSPNWYPEAADQVQQAREGRKVRSTALQVLNCPWCGEPLRADRDLHPDEARRRIILHCGDQNGQCPFSRRNRPDEGLPILTVDEEIYRYAPGLVIATVDKLGQLPWRGYAGNLFGHVSSWCPRHGYRHDDLDRKTGCGSRHNRHPDGAAAVTAQPVLRLRPPDLIIQDELHLIAGALGTTVGLFEAAVDELCTWQADGVETGPKIVASTATVKRAEYQVHQLFARSLAVFPPPVLDHAGEFFSRQIPVSPDTPGRRYLGICAHGVRLKQAEIRIAEILLIAGQYLLDTSGPAADPYCTLVAYFNATRELAGMRRFLDDDIATRVRRHGRLKNLSDRLATLSALLRTCELTSRVSSEAISHALRELDVPFDPAYDTTKAKIAIRDELKLARQEHREPVLPPRRDPEPVDVVLATSMLQVGVDVPRLGLMLITGQPKSTAEYIQASSRIGRDARRPGLVVTLYNWTRPRDLAHYESFGHYHATFYRQVEPLSVTPYSRRALDRTFAGTFVAAVRHSADRFSRNRDAEDVPLGGDQVARITSRLASRAEFVAGPAGGAYLREKAAALQDAWEARKSPDHRLGYEAQRTPAEVIGALLDEPGADEWTALTVAMSMRETETEINLVLPRSGLAEVSAGAVSEWRWRPPRGQGQPGQPDDIPVADEMGDSALTAAGPSS